MVSRARTVSTVRPRVGTVPKALTAQQVAAAYNFPSHTGSGRTVAIIELGGKYNDFDLQRMGLPNTVKVATVDGARPVSDGPNGADGEVMLDVEIVAQAAPGAQILVIFAPNTDAGFYDAFEFAYRNLKAGDAISCSWGGPEDAWDRATVNEYDGLFAACKAALINVFCAAGDQGSSDGERGNHVDFPASSPNVTACGGTQLTVNPDGSRAQEVTWDDSDTSSATGGGDSIYWSRAVPDVAGNASPVTGYEVVVDGESAVIGGTSAVAPLMAALSVRLSGAAGPFDFQQTIISNPQVCFDVTSGDNGAFRAGPGRDKVTGFGVPDGQKMLAVLASPTPPVPPTPEPPPVEDPTPPPYEVQLPDDMAVVLDKWAKRERFWWPIYEKMAAQLWKKFRASYAWNCVETKE